MSGKFGLQLYSVRDFMDKDYFGTIEKVAEMGYTGVEFAGYGGFSAAEIKAKLDALSLEAMSTHIGAEMFMGDELERSMEFLAELDCHYAMIPYRDVKTLDDVKWVAEVLNNASLTSAKYGITCGYHNHGHEFQLIDGEYAMSHLIALTEPAVKMELDVFWAYHAGVDPMDYYEKHSGRIGLLHLKQITEDKKSVDLPDGVIDMDKLCKRSLELGIGGLIVEQEEYAVSSLDSAAKNAEYLKKIL